MVTPAIRFLPRPELGRFLEVLAADGRRVIGPTVVDDAVVYDELTTAADLPIGFRADVAPGRYRAAATASSRTFDYGLGLTGWKRFTHPPTIPLAALRRDGGQVSVTAVVDPPPKLAFVGVRACELAALRIQERVLRAGPVGDVDHVGRRDASLVVAVECATAASTCFCTSMATGPEVTDGADVVLAELDDGFTVRAGSAAGAAIVEGLGLGAATSDQERLASEQVAAVRASIGNPVDTDGLPDRLRGALDHERWAEIAERCLACGNCTLACPTCFCTSVAVTSDLDGVDATTERRWDSCFSLGFGRVAGDANFRPKIKDRYRQWLTHKFSTWWDQFGSSGCVGCGQCIVSCPVGIDIREELAAIAPATAAPASAVPGPIPWPPSPIAGRAPAQLEVAAPVTRSVGTVTAVARETADTVTLRLETSDTAIRDARPGQFLMAEIPAFAAPPISMSRIHHDGVELTIRAAGSATLALTKLAVGEQVALRGPFGRSWPIASALGRDVIVVAGGIGLAPLRPVIDAILADRPRFGSIRLFLGARTPRDRLFVSEMAALGGRADLEVSEIVDRAGPDWLGRVGIVTQLFDQATWDGSKATAFVCGPDRMMQATAAALERRGVAPSAIWLTLERNMACGVGTCGHCQLGPFFVCRDGPVFSVAELGTALEREGL